MQSLKSLVENQQHLDQSYLKVVEEEDLILPNRTDQVSLVVLVVVVHRRLVQKYGWRRPGKETGTTVPPALKDTRGSGYNSGWESKRWWRAVVALVLQVLMVDHHPHLRAVVDGGNADSHTIIFGPTLPVLFAKSRTRTVAVVWWREDKEQDRHTPLVV